MSYSIKDRGFALTHWRKIMLFSFYTRARTFNNMLRTFSQSTSQTDRQQQLDISNTNTRQEIKLHSDFLSYSNTHSK